MISIVAGEIGKRIKTARESFAAGTMRPVDLAERLALSPQRLSNWENGRSDPPLDLVMRISQVLDVAPEWLLGEMVPMRDPSKAKEILVDRGDVRFVPIFGAISAGIPSFDESQRLDWLKMVDWGSAHNRWGRIVDGYSMEPALHDGDVALFEDGRDWHPGQIVHAYTDECDTVKQAKRVHGRMVLAPINPDYDEIDGNGWRVKGVCIGYARKEADGGEVIKLYPNGMRYRNVQGE